MSKTTFPNKPSANVQSSEAPGSDSPATSSETAQTPMTPFWLLSAGQAKKLGQQSTGLLSYHVLADHQRRDVLIAVTANDGGGFFSRERVNFRVIETCLEKYKSGLPFVSKALKEAFISKSANNAGFIVAVLRSLGLLGPALEVSTQHVMVGDWAAWQQKMLAETGTPIELVAEIDAEKLIEAAPAAGHKEHKQTLGIAAKKSP
ncbi:hypothetical protein [Rugamonas sp.]|uniref:hypothetical protein n=1 Tax=Rugamonas sp. TaxID=1926287 RepID=UPI0025E6E8A1|nr:hypothetical protein [Rugamonas sp.]